MDSRNNPRLTILTESGVKDRDIAATISDISDSGCAVILREPLPPDAAVRIEYQDRMFLGEVVYSQPIDGGIRCGIRFRHALNSLKDLSALIEALLEADRPRSVESAQVKMKA